VSTLQHNASLTCLEGPTPPWLNIVDRTLRLSSDLCSSMLVASSITCTQRNHVCAPHLVMKRQERTTRNSITKAFFVYHATGCAADQPAHICSVRNCCVQRQGRLSANKGWIQETAYMYYGHLVHRWLRRTCKCSS
jgi:hypothetical protein